MYYIFLGASSLLFALQFLFYQNYQKSRGSSFKNSLTFSIYSSSVMFLIMIILNGFKLELSLFSFLVASSAAVSNVILGYCTIKAFETASLTVFSMFSQLGGMMLPFVFGIAFFDEKLTISKILSCALIVISLLLITGKGEKKRGAAKYYFLVFVLNGMAGVYVKFHQSYPCFAVSSGSYSALSSAMSFLICMTIFGFKYKSFPKISFKECTHISAYAFFNGVGNLLLLISILHLPASVQYPIVTGGVIVFSSIISFLNKEKITKKHIAAVGTAFVAALILMV